MTPPTVALDQADDLESLVATLAADLATLADAFTLLNDPAAAEIRETSIEVGVDDWPERFPVDDPSTYERPTPARARQDAASPRNGFWQRQRRSARAHQALSRPFQRLAAALQHEQETRGAH